MSKLSVKELLALASSKTCTENFLIDGTNVLDKLNKLARQRNEYG